jgi:hypothetical protein
MRVVPAFVILILALPCLAGVVINEIAYDDTGNDNMEFVELFNAGASTVDISGYSVVCGDTDIDATFAIPGAPGSMTTILASGDFYVLGDAAVPNLDFDIGSPPVDGLQNDLEFCSLRDASAEVIDSIVYERAKPDNTPLLAGHGEPPSDGTSGSSGGFWGELTLQESGPANNAGLDFDGDPNASFSLGRHMDGLDTDDNAADFGIQIATPGTPNNSHGTVSLPYSNLFDDPAGTLVTDLPGSVVTSRVCTPASAEALGAGAMNPSAILPSPQGGNMMVFWDSAGGGAAGIVNLASPEQNFAVEAYVFFEATPLPGAETEEMTIFCLRGNADAGYASGAVNGDSGIRWRYARSSAGGILALERVRGGQISPLGPLILVQPGVDDGWQRLFLQVDGPAVYGRFGGLYGGGGGTFIQGATTIDQPGGIGFGYEEAITDDSTARPLTIDALSITRTPTVPVPVELSVFTTL